MNDRFNSEFNQLKKDMILSLTKFSITGNDEESEEALLNSVLCSFFDRIKNQKQFNITFDSFRGLDQLIKDSLLFDLVGRINAQKTKNEEDIRRALLIYDNLVNDPEYQKLTEHSGYQIPSSFGNSYFYYGNSLAEKVKFYYLFRDKFYEIHDRLLQKEVSHK